MKKWIAAALAMSMMISGAALADGVLLDPQHDADMSGYGVEDTAYEVYFNPETDIDEQNNITYIVYQDDLYPVAAADALTAGDKITSFGEIYTVEKVEKTDEGLEINGGFFDEENGLSLIYADGDPDHYVSLAYDDDLSCTAMGSYTFPLAEQVIIHTYRMDENGEYTDGMDETTVAAGDVKAFFAEHSDPDAADYVSLYGEVSIRVANNEVLEIFVEWTPSV